MSGQTLKDKIWNENISKGLDVPYFEDKMKDNRLRDFGMRNDLGLANR